MPGLKKIQVFKKGFLRFLKVLKRFFLYENRTRKYDPKAREKHPIHGMPYLTKGKSPVSEGEEHHVKMKMKLINLTNHYEKFNMRFIY